MLFPNLAYSSSNASDWYVALLFDIVLFQCLDSTVPYNFIYTENSGIQSGEAQHYVDLLICVFKNYAELLSTSLQSSYLFFRLLRWYKHKAIDN